MSVNDKYNILVYEIAKSKNDNIKPESFGLNKYEFKRIIDEIELDGLFKKGHWILGGGYIFTGLTFKGSNFLESSDKKQYSKIEKTEVNYNNHINVGNNSGNIITGNNNTINSEFNQKLSDLINSIATSDIQDKEMILQELNKNKNNEALLKQYTMSLLGRGAEVASIISAIGAFLS
ncbi:MAG: hypothetical protein WC667_12025 [Sulfurimonas sp.]|jgi:hypothetical protein